MWYGLPGPDGYFVRFNGDAKLYRIPHGGVELTQAQYQQLKTDPKALWVRDGQVKAVDPAVVLADAKAKVQIEIDALRDIRIEAGFAYTFPDSATGTVQMRLNRDVLNITGLGSAASVIASRGGTDPLDFHDAENQSHVMTPAQVLDMALAAQVYYSACYEVAWSHKKAVAALATMGAVAGYDFSGGWPGQPTIIAIGVGELVLAGSTFIAET